MFCWQGEARAFRCYVSSVYDDDIAAAVEMITEDGQLCTWTAKDETVDTTDRWKPASSVSNTEYEDVPIVILPINRVLFESFRRVQNDVEVPQGRVTGYLPGACGFTPKLKDTVELANGNVYAVMFYDVYEPDGNPILYVLQLHQQL